MKKILALVLVLAMVSALFVGCAKTKDAAATGNKADSIPDNMTSSDGKYEIAFVTDVGQLKDKSFNQGTYDGVKLFASENNKTYKYYQPANGSEATDDDRYNAMKDAANNGAKVIVCAGFMQSTALEKAANDFPEVKFVFIDGWKIDTPAMLLSWKATPSSASAAAAAARTPLSTVTAGATSRAPTRLLRPRV